MGLLHDIGKLSLAYQSYIRRSRNEGGPKGPDHSSAGAKEAINLFGDQLGRLMAFGIAGHHAGLMDGTGHEGGSLSAGLVKEVADYTGWQDHVAGLPSAHASMAGLPNFERNAIEAGFSK